MLFLSAMGQAQDLHFTNHEYADMYLNPALTGKFNGSSRYSLVHRNQWSSVTVPYNTMAFTAEGSNLFLFNKLGGGLSAYRDVAGDSKFTNLKVDVALSYSILLDARKRHAISFGLQAGINQFSLDYSKLRYNAQYDVDAGYNGNLPTGEYLSKESVLNPSASFGILYHLSSNRMNLQTGAGFYNLIPTKLNFYETESNPYEVRSNIHALAEVSVSQKSIIIPSVLYSRAQSLSELVIGATHRYQIDPNISIGQKKFVDLGVKWRYGDAVALIAGVSANDFTAVFSYDFNYSDLKTSSKGFGAYEIVLVYILNKTNASKRKFSTCPVFM